MRDTRSVVLTGLAMGVAFLPLPLGLLACVAWIPLIDVLARRVRNKGRIRDDFKLGYLAGFVFYLFGMHWIALLSDVATTMPWIKYLAWVMSGAYLGLFTGLLTMLVGTIARRVGLPVAAVFPPAAVAVEELRASGELGFPWFQPGYALHDHTALLQMASLGGVTLVTLWVFLVNAVGWACWRHPSRRAWLAMALLIALPWGWGAFELSRASRTDGPSVALIQGNIPGEIKWSGDHQAEILATFIAMSDSAAGFAPRPSLTVWPETATGSYLRRQVDQAIAVAALAQRTGIPVFSGFADYELGPDGKPRPLNAAGLFQPNGALGETYAKRHLVPFGERVPFQRWIPALGRIDFGQAEWLPGERGVRFPGPTGAFSALICFESIFPDLARADVRAGSRLLVNVTNDEWFGNSAALYQHAAMAKFRAVENGVPLARCANTGLTAMIDAHGRIRARARVFEPEILVAAIPPVRPSTPWVRLGDWPGTLAGLATAIGVLAALIRKPR